MANKIFNALLNATVDPIALISSSVKATAGGITTTDAIDTTGATLLVIAVSYWDGIADPIISDSKSNTWTGLTAQLGSNGYSRLFYCIGGTVGTGHTFTANQVGSLSAIAVSAYSNVGAYDAESGASSASATTLQPGSITPASNGAVLVTGLMNFPGGTPTINGGFTVTGSAVAPGSFLVGMAYLIQTTAAAANPTWASNIAAERMGATMVSFTHV